MAFGLSLMLVCHISACAYRSQTLVLGHTNICVPFVIRMVSALGQSNPAMIACSSGSAASRVKRFDASNA